MDKHGSILVCCFDCNLKDAYHSFSFLSTTPKITLYSLIKNRTILLKFLFSGSSPASLVRADTHTKVRGIYVAISIFLSRPSERNLERFFML